MRLLISGATRSMERFATDPVIAPHIGHLWTPATGNALDRVCGTGLPWAADNSAFGDQWGTEAFQKAAFLKVVSAPTQPLFLNLRGTTATLATSDYRLVTDDLELEEAAFVLDTSEKLRGLFTAG